MKNPQNITKNLFTFAFICCISNTIFYGNSFGLEKDSTYYKNPEYFIAQKVMDNKIVMLGDANHHYSGVYKTLLKVLYVLASEASSLESDTKLTLILEMGHDDAKILNDFVTTGSLEKIIEKLSPNIFYEDLEYYSNLEKFFSYINNMKSVGKLNIKIEGFEPMDDVDQTIEMIQMAPWQLDSAFLVRDSILSLRINDFITQNPDSKILIFYGDGHLQNKLSPKFSNYGTHGDFYGFYLANYLKRMFGAERVMTFGQKWLSPEFFRETGLAEFEHSNIVAPGKSIDTSKLQYPQNYDYCVFWNNNEDLDSPHQFELVFSRRNVDKYIELIKSYSHYNENEQVKVYLNSRLFFLNLITCNDIKNIDEVIKGNNFETYDGINILKSDCFKKRLYDVYVNSKTKELLKLLGFNKTDLEIDEKSDTLEQFERIWDANLRQIMFINEIGVMWIGYPEEQKMAKNYLIEYSGKDFENPAEYLKWYREETYR